MSLQAVSDSTSRAESKYIPMMDADDVEQVPLDRQNAGPLAGGF